MKDTHGLCMGLHRSILQIYLEDSKAVMWLIHRKSWHGEFPTWILPDPGQLFFSP